jgi:hypothetical protein
VVTIAPAPPVARHRVRVGPAVPWLALAAVVVAGLLATGTPAGDVARYAVYWACCLVLPGTLIFRAVRGSRGNLPEDIGWGATVGLLAELAAWALAAATGLQPLLWAWPMPVVVAFLAVPGLRRHWRIADPAPLPLRYSWAMAGVGALVTGWAVRQWSLIPLPPTTATYYPDLLYHLALVHELERDMPFQVPQVAGQALHYHYLSDAHLATASMITGIDPAVVLFRLWLGPVLLVIALVIAALARQVTGHWWAGPVAAAAALLTAPLVLAGGAATAPGGSPISELSPSETYLLPYLCLATALCVDLARGRPLGRAWVLLPPLALACAGAKASGLPILVAGTALAIVAHGLVPGSGRRPVRPLARRRRVRVQHRYADVPTTQSGGRMGPAQPAGYRAPTRYPVTRRRIPWPALAGLAVLLAGMGVGSLLFVGGGAGGLGFQALSQLPWLEPYKETIGLAGGPVMAGPLPPTMAGVGTAGWAFAAWLLTWWLLVQVPRLVGFGALVRYHGDGAAWLLSGALLSGTGAMWFLFHPSGSQNYFFLPALPFAAILATWLLAGAPSRHRAAILGAAAGTGFVAALLLRLAGGTTGAHATYHGWAWALATPLLCAAALLAVGTLGWWLARRYADGLRGLGSGTVVAALLGAALAAGLLGTARPALQALDAGHRVPGPAAVTAAEMRAAGWLDAHAAPDDVVATNVHCVPVRTTRYCDSRAFWVTGLGGHRALLESWGYTDAAVAEHGDHDRTYYRQPPPFPARYAPNQRAFTAPTPALLHTLYREYHVRWLFADTRAGTVSPRLHHLARLRHTDGPAEVYQLRR